MFARLAAKQRDCIFAHEINAFAGNLLAMKTFRRNLLRSLTSAYPFMSGCGTLSQTKLLRSLVAGDVEPQIVRLRHGREKIAIVPDDYVGRAIYYFGDLDPKITRICRLLLQPGDTALDVGSNMGIVALVMANAVGPQGVVHAFEPQPKLAKLIQQSADLNTFEHLKVHNLALGKDDADLELFIPEGNAGSASLERRGATGTSVRVPVKASGDYLEKLSLPRIRLMKIDVEGHEAPVFAGAFDYFQRNPPDAMLYEANDFSTELKDQAATRALSRLGYRFAEIERSWVGLTLRPFDLNGQQTRRGHDIVAIHDGPNARDVRARLGI